MYQKWLKKVVFSKTMMEKLPKEGLIFQKSERKNTKKWFSSAAPRRCVYTGIQKIEKTTFLYFSA
jgi:hypothetical protein